ncbi:MAG: hypothetical protein NTW28_26085 [Candidatus Solibacter sp.]|nr:hypothetical protein [Candidatus Solibacter sp.]
MLHLRRLMESRPMLSGVPDRSTIEGDAGAGVTLVRVRRGDGYLMAYVSNGRPVTLNMTAVRGRKLRAWWFDPRTGAARRIGEFTNKGTQAFTPPGEPGRGNDWVLVLDDGSRRFPAPGVPLARK